MFQTSPSCVVTFLVIGHPNIESCQAVCKGEFKKKNEKKTIRKALGPIFTKFGLSVDPLGDIIYCHYIRLTGVKCAKSNFSLAYSITGQKLPVCLSVSVRDFVSLGGPNHSRFTQKLVIMHWNPDTLRRYVPDKLRLYRVFILPVILEQARRNGNVRHWTSHMMMMMIPFALICRCWWKYHVSLVFFSFIYHVSRLLCKE